MLCQNLFSGENILKCLPKFLARVLRFKATFNSVYKFISKLAERFSK